MWFIGVEVEQEKSAPPPKKILDPPLYPEVWKVVHSHDCIEGIAPRHAWRVGRVGR